MKKILFGAVSAAALSAFAAPAYAQPAGIRVEAIAGFDSIRASRNRIPNLPDNTTGSQGVVFGVAAGFDIPLGTSAGFGIDVEATESNNDLSVVAGTTTTEIRIGRDLYAGGRITVLASDSGNLYFKGGYTNLRINERATTGAVVVTDNGSVDGLRGGVGAQLNIGANAFFSAEYRYSNYEGDFTRHQGVAGIGFRF
ncbi:MAG TPA: outer membrane beta-barrel protein [Allosphingosinicella sp.]|jgi:outer membrane immunogenic protein